jgi:hypothetical protein
MLSPRWSRWVSEDRGRIRKLRTTPTPSPSRRDRMSTGAVESTSYCSCAFATYTTHQALWLCTEVYLYSCTLILDTAFQSSMLKKSRIGSADTIWQRPRIWDHQSFSIHRAGQTHSGGLDRILQICQGSIVSMLSSSSAQRQAFQCSTVAESQRAKEKFLKSSPS